MCTKTLNCPQHTDALREQIRFDLLGKRVDLEALRGNDLLKMCRKLPQDCGCIGCYLCDFHDLFNVTINFYPESVKEEKKKQKVLNLSLT
jgi:hypothetical protein